jgi:hypothetical protein
MNFLPKNVHEFLPKTFHEFLPNLIFCNVFLLFLTPCYVMFCAWFAVYLWIQFLSYGEKVDGNYPPCNWVCSQ